MRNVLSLQAFSSNEDPTYKKCVNTNGTVSGCEGRVSPTGRQQPSSSTIFDHCTFIRLKSSSDNGGAIVFRSQSNTLQIISCMFNSCESSTGAGGAIYASSVQKVTVQSSLFLLCKASVDGGGIRTDYVSNQPLITASQFISCSTFGYSADAGSVYIFQSSARQSSFVCDGCSFIHSICEDIGGGIRFTNNQQTLGLANCLFYDCHCVSGTCIGLWKQSDTLDYPIRFCFCSPNNNTCVDVYLVGFSSLSASSIFLLCFTTTKDNRVSPAEFNNWLPQGVSVSTLPTMMKVSFA